MPLRGSFRQFIEHRAPRKHRDSFSKQEARRHQFTERLLQASATPSELACRNCSPSAAASDCRCACQVYGQPARATTPDTQRLDLPGLMGRSCSEGGGPLRQIVKHWAASGVSGQRVLPAANGPPCAGTFGMQAEIERPAAYAGAHAADAQTSRPSPPAASHQTSRAWEHSPAVSCACHLWRSDYGLIADDDPGWYFRYRSLIGSASEAGRLKIKGGI